MSEEVEEILSYLEPRNDYVIWAGFAQYAHLGMKPSPDVDIYAKTPRAKFRVIWDMRKNGWKKVVRKNLGIEIETLKKGETTFDIAYSENASKLFFTDVRKFLLNGHMLHFISPEVLLITKMGLLSMEERSEEKRERDIKAINTIRKRADPKKLSKIAGKLPASYWKVGLV